MWLEVIRSPDTSLLRRRYELAHQNQIIGRTSGSAVALQDGRVSHIHATVGCGRGGLFAITDAGSTNGTFVNDRRIDRRTMLRSGDRIRVGRTTLEFIDPCTPLVGHPAAQADPTLLNEQVDPLRTFP